MPTTIEAGLPFSTGNAVIRSFADEAGAEDGHAGGDGDGGPLATGEASGKAHLEEGLAGGVDAGAGVVDEVNLGVLAIGLGEAA
ncbi:MAG: hypothetical protein WBW84_20350 [Acidobacteriaceae bacterium]